MTVGLLSFVTTAAFSAIFGNNQIGLNGIGYYTNLQPFNNWVKSGGAPTWTLTYAGFITSIAAHPTVSGWLQATTSAAHGLYNPNYANQPFGVTGVGGWTITVNNVKNGGTSLSGWTHSGNADVVVDGANTFSWIGTAGIGTPNVADLIVLLNGGNPPDKGSSLHGANSNVLQFIDANGDLQANIPHVTSASYQQYTYGLDFTSGANVPPGFSRNGQKFSIQWAAGTGTASVANGTTNATAPATANFTWTSSLDNLLVYFTITVPTADLSNPPKQIYWGPNNDSGSANPVTIDGHVGELAAWNAGIYGGKTYQSMLSAATGVIRTMDWFQTNGDIDFNSFSQWPAVSYNRWGSDGGNYAPQVVSPVPFAVLAQLANRTNKRPWLNIPHAFTVTKSSPFIGITKSSPGSNAVLTIGNPASPLQIPAKHNFVTGDQIIVNLYRTNLGVPFITNNSAVIAVGGANNVTWTAHGFPAGQNISFPNGGGNTSPGQNYYVTSGATLLTNSFQVSNTLANALAGTPITFSGTGGTFKATSQVNHTQFTVGAVTNYTVELLHCDSSSWGAVTSNGQYAVGDVNGPGGWCTTPFDLTHFGTQVTAMANAAIAQFNSNLIPSWEFGNELWNTAFPSNTMLIGQANNFVDASGTRYFGSFFDKMSGYLAAHAFNTIRTAFGGAGGRAKWVGNLSTQSGSPGTTLDNFTGMDKYIADFIPTLNRNDLFDNVSTTGYWGGGIYQGNGKYFITSASATTFTIDAANTAPSTVTIPSNSNTSASNPHWQYPFLPIIFGGSGTFPNDIATGVPLVGGNGGQLTGFNISGINSSGVMNVTTVDNFPTNTLAAGQSIWLSTSNAACSFWGFTYRKITAQLTAVSGTGGTGTYQTDSNVVQGAANGMLAEDTSLGNGVYWTLPPSTSTTMQFCRHETLARFTGSISNTPGGSYTGQVATKSRMSTILDTTNKQIMSRSHHISRDTISSLKVGIPNWYWNLNGDKLEHGSGGNITYTASIEYPAGTFTQVKFSAATSGVASTNTTLTSDSVSVSIPINTAFWVRIFGTAAVGTVYLAGIASPSSPQCDIGNGEAVALAASGLTDQTMSGTITPTSSGDARQVLSPVFITGTTSKASVLIVGDSRAWGYRDQFTSSGDLGEIARSIGPSLSYISVASAGDALGTFISSHANRVAMGAYVSHVISEYGINDLRASAGGQNRTAAAVLTDLQTVYGYYSANKIYQSTIPPAATSTDSFATLVNQTTDANSAQIALYNNTIRAGQANTVGHFEVASTIESSYNSGKWKVDGTASKYTVDGLHEQTFAYQAIASSGAINPAVLFNGTVTLTVTTAPLAGTPQIAAFKNVGGIGVTEATVISGSGSTWSLNGSAQTVTNAAGLINNMGAYNPVVLDTSNQGSGTFVCQWGGATLLRRWMNDSAALAISTPATWHNKYAYWNYKVNEQLSYGTDAFGGAPIKPFNGGPGSGYSGYFITDMPPLLIGGTGGAGTSAMPNPPGLVQYEGANGNYPVGIVAGLSGLAMLNDPQFYEFLPQCVGTNEQAALWTLQQQVWLAMPAYASNAPYSYNVTGFAVKEQAWFTDVINVTAKFQFGSLYFCDDVSGFGSPNWQQPVNGHPTYDALVASN
jgi:hypothetical protein